MKVNLNANRVAILNALRGANKPLTLAEISAIVGFEVKSGSTNSLVSAGYIVKAGKVEVAKKVKSKVAVYALGETDIKSTKLKADEKRTAILNALKDGEGTLAELSERVGFEIKTGTTNAMLTAGVIAKVGTREIIKDGKAKVETYTFGAEPTAE